MADLPPLGGRQRGAARNQQIEALHGAQVRVLEVEEPPQRCWHKKQAGGAGPPQRRDQIEGLIRRRVHDDRPAAEQHRHGERAPAAEVERRRRHVALASIEAETDPVRQKTAKKMLVLDHRPFGASRRPRRQRQQQRRIAARGEPARRPRLLDPGEPVGVHEFHGNIGGQPIATLAKHEPCSEMAGDPLLLDRGPPAVHRQYDQPGLREPVEDAQMQSAVAQGDADNGRRLEGFRREIKRDLLDPREKLAIAQRFLALDDRFAIGNVAGVTSQRVGEVKHFAPLRAGRFAARCRAGIFAWARGANRALRSPPACAQRAEPESRSRK